MVSADGYIASNETSTVDMVTTTSTTTVSKNQVDNESNNNNVIIRAKRTTDINSCAERVIAGNLVAFPTETVYGLGCNALNDNAIQAVFHAKERPLSDPLIVHVLSKIDAFQLWDATTSNTESIPSSSSASIESKILEVLCDTFWPGPLTLVAKANTDIVPMKIMAGTGYVAIRSPQHPIARALLNASKVPIAAPSANKFGHVSPTKSDHVWDDLKYESVWILEDDTSYKANNHEDDVITDWKSTTLCNVGVESTVAKVEYINDDDNKYVVTVLRQGAVSVTDISTCLDKVGLLSEHDVSVRSNLKRATADNVANVAPGQTIRHYSPHVPSFLVSEQCTKLINTNDSTSKILQNAVVLDFDGRLKHWNTKSLAYHDLSSKGCSMEAAQNVFASLRWAEQIPYAKYILFPELVIDDNSHHNDALTLAIKDRLTRAASGVVINNLDDLL